MKKITNSFKILTTCLFFLLTFAVASADSNFATNSSLSGINSTATKGGGSGNNASITTGENGDTITFTLNLINGSDDATPNLKLTEPADMSYVSSSLRYSDDFGGTWNSITDTNFLTTGVADHIVANGAFEIVKFDMTINAATETSHIVQLQITGTGADVSTKTTTIKVPMVIVDSVNEGTQQLALVFSTDLKDDGDQSDDFLATSTYTISIDGGSTFSGNPSSVTEDVNDKEVTLSFADGTFAEGDNVVIRIDGLTTAQDIHIENTATDLRYETGSELIPDTTAADISTAVIDTSFGLNGMIRLVFSEVMQTADINDANVAAKVTLDNAHTLGTSPITTWQNTTTLDIEMGAGADAAIADTVTIGGQLRDTSGNDSSGKTKVLTTGSLNNDPIVTAFTINGEDYNDGDRFYSDGVVDIATFTGSDDDGSVTHYLITETSTTPVSDDFLLGVPPVTHTLIDTTEGNRIIYAWVKDNNNGISAFSSQDFVLDTTGPTVSADIDTGTYTSSQSVTLSCDDGVGYSGCANIYYTTDGSDPDNTDTLYTIPIDINSDTTLKFIAYDNVDTAGAIVTKTYTFQCAAAPLSNGTLGAYPTCTITCDAGYTLNGSICEKEAAKGGSSGRRSGGGGGGSAGIISTPYQMPTTESSSPVKLTDRGVDLPDDGVFSRPTIITNSRVDMTIEFEQGTQVKMNNGEIFAGKIKQGSKILSTRLPKEIPDNQKFILGFNLGGNIHLNFNKKVKITIDLPTEYQSKDVFTVYYYNDKTDEYELINSDNVSYSDDGKQLLVMLDHFSQFIVVDTEEQEDIVDNNTDEDNTDENNTDADVDIDDEDKDQEIDLPKDAREHWAKNYFEKLMKKGAIKGDGRTGLILPNNYIKRVEALKMVAITLDKEVQGCTEVPFKDVDKDSWYCPYVQLAKEEGWVNGYEKNGEVLFQPSKTIKRGQALKILLLASGVDTEAIELDGQEFKDVKNTDWFARVVKYASDNGFVGGYSDKTFKPLSPITRAEFAKILGAIAQ